jgi:prepilin-type N-terminal cleavage/methylation domain-containing protein
MKFKKGFTLIELLIVILILGALAAIAIPRITQSASTAKTNACATNIDLINSQVELWAARNNGSYPGDIDAICGDPNYFPDNTPLCPFGTAYTLGSDHRVVTSVHNH